MPGNIDCDITVGGAEVDRCGCPFGYGWYEPAGSSSERASAPGGRRGCCHAGSHTTEAEEVSCQANIGFMDCA